MKKILPILLAMVMLFTCAFSAVSLAETGQALSAAQEEELSKVMEWLLKDIPEEEYIQVFSWDRDTFLKKLEAYDQPLETITKEEIADQLSMVTGMFALFATMGEDGGEALAGMFGGLLGGELADYGFDEEYDYDEEDEGIVYDYAFDFTLWAADGMLLDTWFDGEYYLITIKETKKNGFVYSYRCVEDAETGYKNSVGTGDAETDKIQPDNGVATFYINDNGVLIWKKADGGEVAFTSYTDPLNGYAGFVDGKEVRITREDYLHYDVVVQDGEKCVWIYDCMLDEETDTLAGSGYQYFFSEEEELPEVPGFEASFVFQNSRAQLVWTDAKAGVENGLTFEMYEPLLTQAYWYNDDFSIIIYTVDGYYNVHIFPYMEAGEHGYLCLYDRANRTLKAVDPAAIDFDSLTMELYREIYTSTASFVLEDDDRLVWHDDAGAAGDGVVFLREVW